MCNWTQVPESVILKKLNQNIHRKWHFAAREEEGSIQSESGKIINGMTKEEETSKFGGLRILH